MTATWAAKAHQRRRRSCPPGSHSSAQTGCSCSSPAGRRCPGPWAKENVGKNTPVAHQKPALTHHTCTALSWLLVASTTSSMHPLRALERGCSLCLRESRLAPATSSSPRTQPPAGNVPAAAISAPARRACAPAGHFCATGRPTMGAPHRPRALVLRQHVQVREPWPRPCFRWLHLAAVPLRTHNCSCVLSAATPPSLRASPSPSRAALRCLPCSCCLRRQAWWCVRRRAARA